MKISEITTIPFSRRGAIVYSTGNRPVHHWYSVRPIVLPYYMGNVREDHGDEVFDLFLFLPDVEYGVIVRPWNLSDRFQIELCSEMRELDGVVDKATCITYLNRCMDENAFIGRAMIAFVSQWNPERAAAYAAYRLEWDKRREKQAEDRRAIAEAKEAARRAEEKAQKDAEEKAAREKYYGWADKMTPLRFWKADACMETLIRDEGKVMTRRDFVISRVREGWRPELAENITGWYRGNETKPKTEYRLHSSTENCHYTVTKTEYDFASYLVEHTDFTSHGIMEGQHEHLP